MSTNIEMTLKFKKTLYKHYKQLYNLLVVTLKSLYEKGVLMKKRVIFFITILTAFLSFFSFAQNTAANETQIQTVKIKVNGKALVSEYSAVLSQGTTIVPLRPVMEALDCKVEWENETQSIIISKNDTVIKMQIGSDIMFVNDTEKEIPIPAQLIGNTTYIPIRAVSESLRATVGWESSDFSAGISTLAKGSTLTIGQYSATIGDTVSSLISICGLPSYTIVAENGLLWYVYANYPAAFMAVATDAGIVCGYYTNSALFSTSENLTYGSKIPEDAGEYRFTKYENFAVSEYFDSIDGILCAVHCMADGFYNEYTTEEILYGQARIGLDILNSFRYQNQQMGVEWDEAASACSSDHSAYMATSGELSHSGADGSSAIERYLVYNPLFNWSAWGENISAGAKDIYICINGWRNSAYHRQIMLSDKHRAGIGLAYVPDGVYTYCATMLLLK